MYDRILVPTDGSDASQHGLREALRLAKRLGARLRLLHVVDPEMAYLDFSGMVDLSAYVETLRGAGDAILADALKIAGEEGVPADTVLLEKETGTVAELVLAGAEQWQADMIVMGTHGRRGVRYLMLGSDAMAVVSQATIPVVLVRAPATK